MRRLQRTETREHRPDTANELVEQNERLREALERAQTTQGELRELVERITSAPWHPALFHRVVETPQGPRATVWTGGTPRLVNLHPDVEIDGLRSGHHVYLDHELATLMAPSHGGFVAATDTAALERIDVVDISPDVLGTSALIYPRREEDPLEDPRVNVHVEDGRFFLLTT